MTGASSAAAAAAAAVAAELQQLLGRGQNEYNLAAVRARAIELRKDVVEVELALEARAGILKWDDVLKKFSVINTKASARPCPQQRRMCFDHRCGGCGGGGGGGVVAQQHSHHHFGMMHPATGVEHALQLQLASRLRPELLEAEGAAVDSVSARLNAGAAATAAGASAGNAAAAAAAGAAAGAGAAGSGSGSGGGGELALQQQYGTLLDMVFDFDEFVASLVIQGGVLGSQGPLRREVIQQHRAVEDTVRGLQQKQRAINAAAAASLTGETNSKRGPTGAQRGEAMKRRKDKMDPLLMLVLTGERTPPQ
ncbi:MAG: hypothetical protein WDW38_007344 [Sanguina aurantia]